MSDPSIGGELWDDDAPERGDPRVRICRDLFDAELLREDFERAHRIAGDRRDYTFRRYKRHLRADGARIYLYVVVIRKKEKKRGQ